MSVFYVAIGGALGAVGRYGVGLWLKSPPVAGFPWSTFSVNIIGSLCMGLVMGWLARTGPSEPLRLFLAVGLLGGFTTFSAFAYENQVFLKEGDFTNFLIYTLGSISLGLVAVFLGLFISKSF